MKKAGQHGFLYPFSSLQTFSLKILYQGLINYADAFFLGKRVFEINPFLERQMHSLQLSNHHYTGGITS